MSIWPDEALRSRRRLGRPLRTAAGLLPIRNLEIAPGNPAVTPDSNNLAPTAPDSVAGTVDSVLSIGASHVDHLAGVVGPGKSATGGESAIQESERRGVGANSERIEDLEQTTGARRRHQ